MREAGVLHPIIHDLPGALWCGPAAIAALTGFPTSVIHRMVKNERGVGRAVKGMFVGETWSVLRHLGYSMAREYRPDAGGTVADLANEAVARGESLPLLVMTDDHYLVLHEGRYVDSSANTPVPLKAAPARYLAAAVKGAWAVRKIAAPSIPPDNLDKRKQLMREARALARKHGITIDREDERYWYVSCPALEHDDPFDGDGWCGEESDLLAKVERYVQCLTTGYLEAVTDPALLPQHAGA
jgi:hypothetical protein